MVSILSWASSSVGSFTTRVEVVDLLYTSGIIRVLPIPKLAEELPNSTVCMRFVN